MWIIYPIDSPKPCNQLFFEKGMTVKNQFYLNDLTTCRDQLMQAIQQGPSAVLRIVDSCGVYLPKLEAIIKVAENPLAYNAGKGSKISWRSGVNTSAQPINRQMNSYRQMLEFERTMVLCVLASSYIQQSVQALLTQDINDCPESIIQVRHSDF